MVRTNLDKLKQYIDSYIGIPYWSNQLKNGIIVDNGPYGGKGTANQISQITPKKNSHNQIEAYRYRKKHHIGLDCSGLAYHLLNFWYKLHTKSSIEKKIVGTQGKFGPRRVNVKMLSNPQNSIKVNNLEAIRTADLIVINGQKHVLFVVDRVDNQIFYVHSSQKTKKNGVYYGSIRLTNPDQPLNYQQFSDITKTNIPYQRLFHVNQGDGVYRLISLQSIPRT